MEKVQIVIEISFNLQYMNNFCEFVETLHDPAKFTDPICFIGSFNSELKDLCFSEKLNFDQRRKFFMKLCSENFTGF